MDVNRVEMENKPTMDDDFSARLSDEMHEQLSISEGPSSCRRIRERSRPTLQSTKSFPPYSQCIGGLGEEEEEDNELNSESSNVGREVVQKTERKEDFELRARCARDEVKAKWRIRKERLGGSYEAEADGWERVRWKEKGRVWGANSEWNCWRNSSFDDRKGEKEDEDRKRAAVSEDRRDEEAKELLGGTGDPAASCQRSSPHPILSKLLSSSSSSSISSSSCSSINFSSAESDEVFSEGEDASSKRRAFRKVRMDG